ncbi:hypothetical protein [Actinoplanes friuliensis]|uniref:Uncharacterized protein n=1 Tax=Actinoplanes friuliensis DSM 7358 TaxID=1246995 RepID=U5W108_9ACTN|nr:hypothetical protein [Actinoplanes friuliensis]AGZ42943.1 hypothetical protein AFR_23365 [Actinoplanes friuliensis DSM 7358]
MASAACLVLTPAAAVATPARPAARPAECATPSIDRLQQWLASGEGTTVPATGSLLLPNRHGDRYTAKVDFVNAEWHVVVVWLANEFEAQVDLADSKGFWLTYSATEDLYVQLRPASHWSGGAQWATAVPSTQGRTVTRFFSFRPQAWGAVPELGAPAHSFASALSEARGLVFVGKTANELSFRGLRIHRYTPPCL